jgi:hypothetical protein
MKPTVVRPPLPYDFPLLIGEILRRYLVSASPHLFFSFPHDQTAKFAVSQSIRLTGNMAGKAGSVQTLASELSQDYGDIGRTPTYSRSV